MTKRTTSNPDIDAINDLSIALERARQHVILESYIGHIVTPRETLDVELFHDAKEVATIVRKQKDE